MSVPYLIAEGKGQGSTASSRIPVIARPFVSDRAKKTLDIVGHPLDIAVLPIASY